MLKQNLYDKMKTTAILFICQVFCLAISFGQIELENANILIIGYDNVLSVSENVQLKFPNPMRGQTRTNGWGEEEITPDFYEYEVKVNEQVQGFLDGTELTDVRSTGSYKVIPDANYFKDNDSLIIEFYSSFSGTLISKRTYILRSLPLANIYWGASTPGDRILGNDTRLFAKFGPEIPLNATFKIATYEVTIGDKKFNGIGSTVSTEVMEALKQLKRGGNTTVTVSAVYYSEYDQLFEATSTFKY
jgi:hypothetical protein